MKLLKERLNSIFKPPSARKPDAFRKSRELAKKIARIHGIEIERLRDGGFNLWPPRAFVGTDPMDGDHYSIDWLEVLKSVEVYAEVLTAEAVKPAAS